MIDILVCMGCYRPGHDATGPNQSLRGMMAALSGFARFSVLAELGKDERASGQMATDWAEDGLCRTRRLPARRFGAAGLAGALRETPHDILVVTSLFDPVFSIAPVVLRRAGRIARKPTILAPRGELSPGALSIAPARKRAYLALSRRLALHDDLWFHATGPSEAGDIRRSGPCGRGIHVAENLAPRLAPPAMRPRRRYEPLRAVFLSRIAPLKNLLFALDILRDVSVPIRLDIVGPKVDPAYWARCERAIAALPSHVTVRERGLIAHADVPGVLAEQDLFILPTLGENFGHAIIEALACGVPALVSDRTPWRDLRQAKAGWDLPLDEPGAFRDAIHEFAALDEAGRTRLKHGARRFAERHHARSDAASAHRLMFERVLSAGP